MALNFHVIYGMSSFPLTNPYFSRWLLHHQPESIIYSNVVFVGPYWTQVASAFPFFFIAGREALLLPMEAIGEVNGEATPGKKDRTMVMVNDA
jgi:hypothetical protein